MKLALIGATGNVGSRLLKEALDRGHAVTAIARNTQSLAAHARLTARALDFTARDRLLPALAGHDAVIAAVKYHSADPVPIVEAVRKSGVKRLLVIGGAGSLRTASGLDVVETPQFPAQWKPEALAARDFLIRLRKERELDWTFLSPSALLGPGVRTGKFRVGGDDLLVDAKGESRISLEDLAVALIDELEKPRHSRQRFTVGY